MPDETPQSSHTHRAASTLAGSSTEWIRANGPRVRRAGRWAQIGTGMLLVGLAHHTGKVQFALRREGVSTSGRIVRFEYGTEPTGSRPGRALSMFFPIVEFEVDGRRVRFRDHKGSASSGGVGEVVPVLVSAERPSIAMIERPLWNWIPWASTFVVGAFLVLVGTLGTLGKLRQRAEVRVK